MFYLYSLKQFFGDLPLFFIVVALTRCVQEEHLIRPIDQVSQEWIDMSEQIRSIGENKRIIGIYQRSSSLLPKGFGSMFEDSFEDTIDIEDILDQRCDDTGENLQFMVC